MLMMKFIGKPYAGKPHVRFDEGAGKVDLPLPALLYRDMREIKEKYYVSRRFRRFTQIDKLSIMCGLFFGRRD
jgi:hypothetical protein